MIICAIKLGDSFSSRLVALLNLPLTEKIIRSGVVEYHFQTVVPERLHVVSRSEKEAIETIEINLGNGVVYNLVK